MSTSVAGAPKGEKSFFGHPRGLANLFSIEVWERFSFYGMQAVLTLYLFFDVADGGLGLEEGQATSIVGAYGGSVYLSTILGAWVADRLLGSERTLFYSGVLIMVGHIGLAVLPGFTGVVFGLLCVGVGSGGLKANASSLLGSLYQENDVRRDAGFSIFYMGINVGALFGPLLTGLARVNLGFHYGFGLAAIGMAIGLVQYTIGRKNLSETGRTVPNPLPREQLNKIGIAGLVGAAIVVAILVTGVIPLGSLSTAVTVVVVVAAALYLTIMLRSKQIDATEHSRVVAFIPLLIANFAFWSLFQQQFTVMPVYATQRVDKNLFGFEIIPEWFNSVNPVFIILLAPVFAFMWIKLGNRQPSTPIKFALGVIGVGLGALIFVLMAGSGETSPPLGLVAVLLVFTLGELSISPVGLSLSTKLAPRVFRTQMLALYFLSVAAGSSMAGVLAGFYTPGQNEAAFFGTVGGAAIAVGLLMAAISPWVLKLMRGVK